MTGPVWLPSTNSSSSSSPARFFFPPFFPFFLPFFEVGILLYTKRKEKR